MRRSGVRIPSAPPCDLSRDPGQSGPGSWVRASAFSGLWSRWSSEWLVVAGDVDGELAEQFAGGGVDDPDVVAVDELEDWGSGVLGADADVMEPAVEAEGELAFAVDFVVEDAVVGLGAA